MKITIIIKDDTGKVVHEQEYDMPPAFYVPPFIPYWPPPWLCPPMPEFVPHEPSTSDPIPPPTITVWCCGSGYIQPSATAGAPYNTAGGKP